MTKRSREPSKPQDRSSNDRSTNKPLNGPDVDPVVAVLLEVRQVDAAHLGIVPIDVGRAELAVGHFEDGIVEAHLLRQ